MHLFLELYALACLVACNVHAVVRRGSAGAWFFFGALLMGAVRENVVVILDMLYGYAPLTFHVGRAPVIGATIWAYSIYGAISWSEAATGERFDAARPRHGFVLLACLYMVALAFFFEPFLRLVGMARWEQGTRTVQGVPLIAIIGYPSMTWLFLESWFVLMRGGRGAPRRAIEMALVLGVLAALHALALSALKRLLGW